MFFNYLKIALRNLSKHKLHTLINVSGLAMGIASVFLITLYVSYELNYDQHLKGSEDVYRIVWENENPQTRTPHPMAQALKDDFPEVESAVSLSPLWASGLTRRIFSVRNLENDLRFDEQNVLAVDTAFFDVFPFPIVSGDAEKALRNVNGILISESTAKKYFGTKDPLGKHLAVNSDAVLLEVMAVFKDIPAQSHFHFDMLVSYVREKSFDPDAEYYTWADFGHFNYLRLKPGTDHKHFESQLMEWSKKYITWPEGALTAYAENGYGFKVQPVKDIHLHSHLRWELETNGNIEYVYIMAAAALLTLLIACINFMNLMTAKSTERAKEIGIRKTLGALRKQLSFQFLSESVIIALISIVLAVLLIEVTLPFYTAITEQAIDLNYVETLPLLIGLGVVVGLLSGVYPSLFLSSVLPHATLKGKYLGAATGNRLRNSLIVLQFAISMTLICGAAIIFSQLDYISNKNLGFNKEEVLVIPLKNASLRPRVQALKAELSRIEGVTSVSASSNLPGGQFNQNPVFSVEDPEEKVDFSEAFVEYDLLKTLNIELAEGRFFSPENQTDTVVSFVINESGARQLNLGDAIGKQISWDIGGMTHTGQVLGVMKDFHFQSFHRPVQPLLFVHYPSYNHLVIKLTTHDFENKIAQIEKVYKGFDDSFGFEFSFLDDRLNNQYKAEQHTGIIFGLFAFIAIMIACFGLFGMAMLTFHQRMKEMSIRKVLGASFSGLIVLLLSDFTKLILIAILLATPFAWWIMDRWLNNFTFQVGVNPFIFLFSGLVLVLISWATLSYFTLKVSRINPAETLKSE